MWLSPCRNDLPFTSVCDNFSSVVNFVSSVRLTGNFLVFGTNCCQIMQTVMTNTIHYASQLYKIGKLLSIIKIVLSVLSLGILYIIWDLLTRPVRRVSYK
jgi:hypothetical protein